MSVRSIGVRSYVTKAEITNGGTSLAEQQLFAKEPNNSFGPRDLVIRVGQTVARFRVLQLLVA
jgi:hypothetical protein